MIANKIKELGIKVAENTIALKNNRIVFIDFTPNSGSNVKILYDKFSKENKNMECFYLTKKYCDENKKEKFNIISSSKYVVTSHGYKKLKKDQINIELWHGIPLKKMGLREGKGKIVEANYYISSSETYSSLLNACIGADGEYLITGFPRNDYLLNPEEMVIENIKSKLNIEKDNKVYVFMPTFRKGFFRDDSNLNRNNNIFGFEHLDISKFNKFLHEKKVTIITKLHPAEENYFLDKLKNYSNFKILPSSLLEKEEIDIYQVLAHGDALITDYSSVYFDYLLKDKPIIFLNNDIEEYEKNRGFLMEPINFWLPGKFVGNYEELKDEIKNISDNTDKFKEERNIIKQIMHRSTNESFTKNVISQINTIIDKHN